MTCKICKKNKNLDPDIKTICVECANKAFPITSVCRADLKEDFTPEQIAKFDDGKMEHLASKMADAYCDNGFWIDLEILGEYELEG